MYTYASDADYYICAMKVYEQEYTLLQGRKIAQPMKYISNALLAVVIAVVINYIIVRVYPYISVIHINNEYRSALRAIFFSVQRLNITLCRSAVIIYRVKHNITISGN